MHYKAWSLNMFVKQNLSLKYNIIQKKYVFGIIVLMLFDSKFNNDILTYQD